MYHVDSKHKGALIPKWLQILYAFESLFFNLAISLRFLNTHLSEVPLFYYLSVYFAFMKVNYLAI